MEEQTEEWTKDYVVERCGRMWRIRGVPGLFTDKFHAEKAAAGRNNTRIDKTLKSATRKIRNSGDDIKKRMKDYKQLCQATPEYS